MLPEPNTVSSAPWSRALEELQWLAFYLPRQGVQSLARRVPLAALRDRLPAPVAARLRFGLYPARITRPPSVSLPRRHPAWGDPADLDPSCPVRYPGQPPHASVLIATYGNLDLTRLCLASLQRAAGAMPFEVIVVDNASPDGSASYLRQVAAGGLLPLTLLANPRNEGFARANNQAAARARGDLLVFLNNDTVVTRGWLERLAGHLGSDAGIGLVGPVTNSCGNQAEVPAAYRDVEEMFAFADGYVRAHPGQVEDIPMLTLFCAATRRSLFESVGGLDERYRVGMFEDDDLSEAVRRAGKRVVLARDVFVHHYGSAALSRLSDRAYLRVWWQNRRRFERKWGTRWQKR
jgi:GT2 family glycosyltransferase